jgi:hypothetical protein
MFVRTPTPGGEGLVGALVGVPEGAEELHAARNTIPVSDMNR